MDRLWAFVKAIWSEAWETHGLYGKLLLILGLLVSVLPFKVDVSRSMNISLAQLLVILFWVACGSIIISEAWRKSKQNRIPEIEVGETLVSEHGGKGPFWLKIVNRDREEGVHPTVRIDAWNNGERVSPHLPGENFNLQMVSPNGGQETIEILGHALGIGVIVIKLLDKDVPLYPKEGRRLDGVKLRLEVRAVPGAPPIVREFSVRGEPENYSVERLP